ncbi:hypothetical protein COX69_03835 [Candidatus Falkowbacteria bacterium CG_4_10_14_0_2_um_filter_48_10]|uniref:Uncharacterized protein n=1 Tax=Candidatus Falkowbacteria bacterium CG23_combo_of_CG06-09_8_20_14_all_49_15 TaxID=1974572 RepID=A0A2G9ZKH5_9BACT|nr:MAG: hypothetical protein COX22_03450 [Candidatus Falkowbacteria bacterium CG23_combo_of_CG06-09_8_20_14_all_49_15]PJA07780.1 MAG: hypothetical protein COX69_03835 [Candidatus Falkowbacteria bacterium CG_4_10_14_0_2_um_filter_48_10]
MISIILGLLIAAAGLLMVVKSESLYDNFGSIEFFERYFHLQGGGRFGYKLIGIMIIFIGILMFTHLLSGFLLWILGPMIRVMGGPPE